jgi:hypothetical protein
MKYMGANDKFLKKINKAGWNVGKWAKKFGKHPLQKTLKELDRKDKQDEREIPCTGTCGVDYDE